MENRLDKYFRNKMDQRTFDYKDSYWKKMEGLLDQNTSKKTKRRPAFWIILLFLLISGSFMFYQFIAGSNKTLVTNDQVPEDQLVISNSSLINSIKSENQSELQNETGHYDYSSIELKKSSSLGAAEITLDAINQNQNKSLSNKQYKPIDKSNKDIKSTGIASNTSSTDVFDEGTTKYPTKLSEIKNEISNSNARHGILNSIEFLPYIPGRLENMHDLQISTLNINQDLSKFGAIVIRRDKFNFGVLGGINSNTELYGINLGLGFRVDVNPVWIIRGSIQYNRMTGISPMTKRKEVVTYGFRASTQDASLKAKSFHFIELPVSIDYRFFKHNFGVGFRLKYLAGIRGEIENIDTENENPTIRQSWIVTDGFKRLISSFGIQYAYDFSDRISLNVHLDYSINGLNNSVYEAENDIDLGLKSKIWSGVSLSYYLKK